jgi:hypothetical protein
MGVLHENLCTSMISRLCFRSIRNIGRFRQTADSAVVLCMRTECCVTKATDKQSEYVVLTAFSRLQSLGVHRLTVCLYVLCLVWTLKPSVQ